MSAPRPPRRISRRALVGGAVGLATLGLGLAEWQSFKGRFDHRRWPGVSAPDAFADSVKRAASTKAAIVHLAHSTHLLVIDGVRLLTDPWFFDPALGALSHEIAPAVAPESLGTLDALLVSHDHADHADLRAMDRMDKRAKAIVATNDLAARVRALGFGDVVVLAPWEKTNVGAVEVYAVPGLHDIHEIGFVVKGGGKSMYFAGDSRLHPDLPAIAERFAPEVAILPVDGTRVTGGDLHVMTPEDAVTAARTLKAGLVVPSHAEAVFSDPLAKHVLASTVARARFVFEDLVARDLPHVRCIVPRAGQLISM